MRSSAAGHYFDLPLTNTESGYSILPPNCVTLRHRISESSPLHSCKQGRQSIQGVQVSVCATDATTGGPVYEAAVYVNPEAQSKLKCPNNPRQPRLEWGAKFKNMISVGADGAVQVDLDNFSRVVSGRSLKDQSSVGALVVANLES